MSHGSRARIVVLDGRTLNPGDNPWDPVAALGELDVHPTTAPGDVFERARGASVVLTNKTRLGVDTLTPLAAAGLRMVGVLATGYDVVDVAAAAELGVVVCNVPEYGTDAVAEFVLAQILTWARRPVLHDAAVRRGEWVARGDFSFHLTAQRELAGATLGVVGLGRIGARVAQLGAALGMSILAAGRPGRPVTAPAGVARFSGASIAGVFGQSDVVSLHCPLTDASRGMVDAAMLARMPPESLLINTARGALIDERALTDALRRGRPGWACLDVAQTEPMAPDHPLLALPNCTVTPHMAWSTLAARRRLMETTAANIRAFLDGRPQHAVTG